MKVCKFLLSTIFDMVIILWLIGVIFGLLGFSGTVASITVIAISILIPLALVPLRKFFLKTPGDWFFSANLCEREISGTVPVVKFGAGVVIIVIGTLFAFI